MNSHLLRIVTLLAFGLLWPALQTPAADGGGLVGETEKLKARIAKLEARLDRSEKRNGVSAITTNGTATIEFGKLFPSMMPWNASVSAGSLELTVIAIDENLNEINDSRQQVQLRWGNFTMPPPPPPSASANPPFLTAIESSSVLQPFDLSKIKAVVLKVKGQVDPEPGVCAMIDFDLVRATRSAFGSRVAQRYPLAAGQAMPPDLVTQIPVNTRPPNATPVGLLVWGSVPILLKIEERR